MNVGDINQINFNGNTSGKTNLFCWSKAPTGPTLSKNKKLMLQNFGQLAFFNLLFSAF